MRNLFQGTACTMAAIVLTSGLVAFADPANANVPAAITPHAVVQTADLNLAAPAGRATAERRIHQAAEKVCGSDGNAMSVSGQCREQAVTDAEVALQAQAAQH